MLFYFRAARRFPSWSAHRRVTFAAGIATGLVATASPLATYAHGLFSIHMAQHLLLMLVCAPLLLLGAPITLALRSSGMRFRRRLLAVIHSPPARALTHPLVAWVLFAVVMWFTHFTPFYDAALDDDLLHSAEHVLYLGAALLFWAPVVGRDPWGLRLSHPARLAYLFLAVPQQAFLALALWSSSTPLYPHYETIGRAWAAEGAFRPPAPLDDQRAGALVMWLGGELVFVAAIVLVTIAWMRHDEREAARIDRRLDAEQPRAR